MTSSPILDAGARIVQRRLESGVGWDPGLDADAETIRFQQCVACGFVRYPRATFCPECLSPEAVKRAVSGLGTIWSFAIYHHCYDEAFADALPYVVALVELDEGPRLIGALIETPTEGVTVGRRVTAVSRELQPDQYCVYFRSCS
jgi:uncharacterized OB-fold protein